MSLEDLAAQVSTGLELAGIIVVALGALISALLAGTRLARGREWITVYRDLRRRLGRAILLGLEFLVAADIVHTVAVQPTLQSVGVLGLIVVVRTFLSFALEVEINGRWPWQRSGESAHAPPAQAGS